MSFLSVYMKTGLVRVSKIYKNKVGDLRDTLVSFSFVKPVLNPYKKRLTCWVLWVFHYVKLDILPFKGVGAPHVFIRLHQSPGPCGCRRYHLPKATVLMSTPNSREMHVHQCHDVVRLVQEVINIIRRLRLCPHIKFVLINKSSIYQLTKLASSIHDL